MIIQKFFSFVEIILRKVARENRWCRIEEINLLKRVVIVHCRGVDAPVKLDFNEIINDSVILSNLSPKHASWVGYYYGKYYSDLVNKKYDYSVLSDFDFSIGNSLERFSIVMLNRYGDLIYSDRDSDTMSAISPIRAITDERIIAKFGSIQACYIGILAGASSTKKDGRKLFSHSKNVHLELVK